MTDISFEKALKDLENIVGQLEKGGLSLNESLSLFEKGVKLARFLRKELEKAEKKITILLKDEKGQLREEDFELAEEQNFSSHEEDSPPLKKDDDEPPF